MKLRPHQVLTAVLSSVGHNCLSVEGEQITAEMIDEYDLIKQKKSKLSKSKRDAIVRVVDRLGGDS